MPSPDEGLRARVEAFLEAEDFSPGERIGPERLLAARFGVSRSELRRVLEVLERAGRVRRTIGRSGGVYSWDGKIERHLNTIQSVPDMLRQQGFQPATTVLSCGIAAADAAERRALRLDTGESVFRLRRRRDADGVTLSLDAMSLPLRLLPGIEQLDHGTSVYRMLSERYRVEPGHANESIHVVPATTEQAEVLRLPPGAPLFAIRRVTYTPSGIPFEWALDHFVASRTRITLDRHGARWKRAGRAVRPA